MMENTVCFGKEKTLYHETATVVGEVRTDMLYSYQCHHGLPQ